MNKLQTLIDRVQRKTLADIFAEQSLIDSIFVEHRNRMISTYCAMIRFHYEVARRNSVKTLPPFIFTPAGPEEGREWCNAAVHILIHADDAIQRFFLASDLSMKTKIVNMVLDDGGIETDSGTFSELPPL